MTRPDLPGPSDLPPVIAASVSREKLSAGASLANIHPWWARRPLGLARVASFLALSEAFEASDELLGGLAETPLTERVISEALLRIRDTQWRSVVRDSERPVGDGPKSPGTPRLIDPFAGGGSIPAAAAQLGCDAFAGDIEPLAFHVLRGTLVFPQALGEPNVDAPGSGPDGRWQGLPAEVSHWTARVGEIAASRLGSMYLDEDAPVDGLLWVHRFECDGCSKLFPGVSTITTTGNRQSAAQRLRYCLDSETFVPASGPGERTVGARRSVACPFCGATYPRQVAALMLRPDSELLAATIRPADGAGTVLRPVAPDSQLTASVDCDRVKDLRASEAASGLGGTLPEETYRGVRRHGFTRYEDLFSGRQLAANLEFLSAAELVCQQMAGSGMTPICQDAIRTYIAFLVGFVVDRNSRLCRWDGRLGRARSLARMSATLPREFVETNVTSAGLLDRWRASVLPTLDRLAALGGKVTVTLGDASRLERDDASFDAIVTDPPFFDRVPYPDLSGFFWAWEGALLSAITPAVAAAQPASSGSSTEEQHRVSMSSAFGESYRVLKPGRLLCMLITTRTREAFDEYVVLGEGVGFEIVDVRRLEENKARRADASTVTFLVFFRKPDHADSRRALGVDAHAVLEDAEANRPVLYEGLARLLLRELDEESIAELTVGMKGADTEKLMEVLAESDPRELLERYLGKQGVRRLAAELTGPPTPDQAAVRPMEALLSHFGFRIRSPVEGVRGPHQTAMELRRLRATCAGARDKSNLRGALMDGCTLVERTVRIAVWAWARLAFGDEAEARLASVLRSDDQPGRCDLQRITFGQLLRLFGELPDVIAASPVGAQYKGKLGRAHVYLPKKKPARLFQRLEKLIQVRNRVEHDRDGYWTGGELRSLRPEVESALGDAERLIEDLVLARAVPRLAAPTLEMRDEWNRRRYRLLLDDGTEIEVSFSNPVELGAGLLYFGSASNPRPVDPLALTVAALGRVP